MIAGGGRLEEISGAGFKVSKVSKFQKRVSHVSRFRTAGSW
jgi:hypothetical protein